MATTNKGLGLSSPITDGATAVAHYLDTVNNLATAGALLLSLRNAGTQKFAVGRDGSVTVTGAATLQSTLAVTGAATFSSTATLSALTAPEIRINHPVAASDTHVLEVYQVGDAWARVILRYDGHLVFGAGNIQHDIRIKRTGAGLLEVAKQDGVGGNLGVQGKLGVGLAEGTAPTYELDVYGTGVLRLRNSGGAPTILTWREDATPTVGDNLFSWEFFGPDSNLAYDRYGYIRANSTVVTAGSKEGEIDFVTFVAGAELRRLLLGKNMVLGNAALATTATDGFVYIPSCAGAPTGVPTAYAGRVPLIFDTTNNKLWAYDGGWIGAVLA